MYKKHDSLNIGFMHNRVIQYLSPNFTTLISIGLVIFSGIMSTIHENELEVIKTQALLILLLLKQMCTSLHISYVT